VKVYFWTADRNGFKASHVVAAKNRREAGKAGAPSHCVETAPTKSGSKAAVTAPGVVFWQPFACDSDRWVRDGEAWEAEPATFTFDGFGESAMPTAETVAYLLGGPNVVNGSVRVDRYRVTIERIEEPRDVLLGRLVDLYRATTNMRVREALCREANERFGVKLNGMAKEPT
jgi:hypothetical protein